LKKTGLLLALFFSLGCGLMENVSPTAPNNTVNLKSTPSSTPAPTFCQVKTGIENGGLLNLRAGPGVSYMPIQVLHEGESIVLANIPARNGWQFVKVHSIEGWVNKIYIKCEAQK